MAADYQLTDNDYELISAYIDGMLTDAERSEFEARLQSIPLLRDELNAMQQTVSAIQTMPVMSAPRNFILTPEMVSESPSNIRPLPQPRKQFTWIFAAAAVFVVILGVGFALLQPDGSIEMASSPQQIAAAPTATPTEPVISVESNTLSEPADEDFVGDEFETGEEGALGVSADAPPPAAPIAEAPVESEVAEADFTADAIFEEQAQESLAIESIPEAEDESFELEADADFEDEADGFSDVDFAEAEELPAPLGGAALEAMPQSQPIIEITEEPELAAARMLTESPSMDDEILADGMMEESIELRLIGDKMFILDEDTWIDDTYNPSTMQLESIVASSEAANVLVEQYDILDKVLTELNDAQRIIIVLDEIAYEFLSE